MSGESTGIVVKHKYPRNSTGVDPKHGKTLNISKGHIVMESLLTTHYSLLTTHYSLLTTTHYSLLTTHY